MRWYSRMGRRVWLHEWREFLFRDRRVADGPTLRAFWGEPQDAEEVPVRVVRAHAARTWLARVEHRVARGS